MSARPVPARVPVAQSKTARAPKRRFIPQFHYFLIPGKLRFQVDLENGRAFLVPSLQTLPHLPGVGGVGSGRAMDGKRVGDPKAALGVLKDKGYKVVPRLGEPGGRAWSSFGETAGDYCRAWENADGSRFHLPFYSRPIDGPAGQDLETDWDAFLEFMSWIEDNLSVAPTLRALVALEKKLARDLIPLSKAAERSSLKAARHENRKLELEAIQAKIEAIRKPAKPVTSDSDEVTRLRALVASLQADAAKAKAESGDVDMDTGEGAPDVDESFVEDDDFEDVSLPEPAPLGKV